MRKIIKTRKIRITDKYLLAGRKILKYVGIIDNKSITP